MNPNDELNGLGYVNSAPSLVQQDTPHPKDEAEISTLDEVFVLLENRKQYYLAIESLSLDDKNFSVDQQLSINKKVLFHIQELESKIMTVVEKVRAKQNGREY